MELTARIHIEDGSYWADVPELPGCFASGDTLDELFESLQEGVVLYLADEGEKSGPLHVATATLTGSPADARVKPKGSNRDGCAVTRQGRRLGASTALTARCLDSMP